MQMVDQVGGLQQWPVAAHHQPGAWRFGAKPRAAPPRQDSQPLHPTPQSLRRASCSSRDECSSTPEAMCQYARGVTKTGQVFHGASQWAFSDVSRPVRVDAIGFNSTARWGAARPGLVRENWLGSGPDPVIRYCYRRLCSTPDFNPFCR